MGDGKGRGFEHLDVYRLSEQLADAAWRLVIAWPNVARDTAGKQLIRAADSVGANIAEGSGRGTDKDNGRFIHIARGSPCETRHWLRRAHSRDLLAKEHADALGPIVREPGPRLNAFRNHPRSRPNNKDR